MATICRKCKNNNLGCCEYLDIKCQRVTDKDILDSAYICFVENHLHIDIFTGEYGDPINECNEILDSGIEFLMDQYLDLLEYKLGISRRSRK